MQKKATPETLQTFLNLRRQGKTNTVISKTLKVSQQTLTAWANSLPQVLAEQAVLALQKRLLKIAPTATPAEISQMQDAISKAQKMALSNIL